MCSACIPYASVYHSAFLPVLFHRYELVLQLDPSKGPIDDPVRVQQLTSFVVGVFSDATLLSENGGLLTYRVPQATVKVGAAFAALEAHHARLLRVGTSVRFVACQACWVAHYYYATGTEKDVSPLELALFSDGVMEVRKKELKYAAVATTVTHNL